MFGFTERYRAEIKKLRDEVDSLKMEAFELTNAGRDERAILREGMAALKSENLALIKDNGSLKKTINTARNILATEPLCKPT